MAFGFAFAVLWSRPAPEVAEPEIIVIEPDTPISEDGCTTMAFVPASGGVFVEGALGAPLYLNPLLSDNQPLDRELVSLIFDGLTRYDENGRLQPNLAQSWQVAEDGLSVRFTLRSDAVWHDGQPVTANDVAFTYGLMQDDAFAGAETLRRLWQAVVINVVDVQTVEFVLAEPYSPFLEATTRGILPAHLLQGVTGATLLTQAFNRSPVGTGPFVVPSGQDWSVDGRLRLLPNPNHWQSIQLDALDYYFYPDEATLLDAFNRGEIDAINRVTASLLPGVGQNANARLFTAPIDRYMALFFNVSEESETAVRDLSVRRALAYGLDRKQLLDETMNGQGLVVDGPYMPSSGAYSPASLTHYSYQPITATNLLVEAGWSLVEGTAVRQQEEASLEMNLLTLSNPVNLAMAQNLVSQWGALGIGVEVTAVPDVGVLRTTMAAREFDIALVEINPPADPDLYDFWSQEAIVDGQNYGGWNNRRASEALEQARQTWEDVERRPFYDAFIRLYDADLPAFTLFQPVYTYAVNNAINGVEIGKIAHPRDRYTSLADWFMVFEEVAVACEAVTGNG